MSEYEGGIVAVTGHPDGTYTGYCVATEGVAERVKVYGVVLVAPIPKSFVDNKTKGCCSSLIEDKYVSTVSSGAEHHSRFEPEETCVTILE